MATPVLSVLLPVHNTAPYLPAALASLVAQTHTDFEVVAIDDGSSDGSAEILDEFARRDPRFRVLRQPKSGIVVALNRAMAEAKAELVARMDGDDVCLPQRFERQLAYLNEHPACVVVGTAALVVDEDGDPISPMPIGFGHEQIDEMLLAGRGSAILHPSAVFRKSTVISLGGYRPGSEGAEDLDLYLRLVEVGRVANLDETLLHFRKRAGSVTASTTRYGEWQLQQSITAEARRRRGLSAEVLPVNRIWRPQGPDELHFWVAVFALKNGYRQTALKHARRLLVRPDGPLALAKLLGFRLGPHLARKYYRMLRARVT